MKVNKWVKEYQCSGCVTSPEDGCFKKSDNSSCSSHCPGTLMLGMGKLLLGMPKGFNRMGPVEKMNVSIFKDEKEFKDSWGEYTHFNVPVWKYKNEKGHVFVRGLSPRINSPFIHVFLYPEAYDQISCQSITDKELEKMD